MLITRHKSIIIFLSFLVWCACIPTFLHSQAPKKGRISKVVKTVKGKVILYGQASFYATKFEGRKTASGAIFRNARYTAACNALPLGTWVKITNLKNKRTVVVQINDRLHTKTTRLMDLTKAAAKKLNYLSVGLARVKVEVLPAEIVGRK